MQKIRKNGLIFCQNANFQKKAMTAQKKQGFFENTTTLRKQKCCENEQEFCKYSKAAQTKREIQNAKATQKQKTYVEHKN